MAEFLISDQHFYHSNILNFEDRPFDTLEEMESSMVKAWNEVVGKKDRVIMLGDFCFGGPKIWYPLLDQLKGHITLIKGNHDSSNTVKKMIAEGMIDEYHPLGTIIKIEKHVLNLSHYPMDIGVRPRLWSIHGHLHAKNGRLPNMVNVGVDNDFAKSLGRPFGTPIPMEELVVHLNERIHVIEELFEMEREKR